MEDDKGAPSWTLLLSGATSCFGPPEFEAQIVLRGEAPTKAAAEAAMQAAIDKRHADRVRS
jgi:hypothetical protein